MTIKQFIWRLSRNERGAAAVELALILPIIVATALASIVVWDVGMRKQDLHGALRASSQYYINGGKDDTVAVALGLASWQRKPAGATLVATRECKCGAVAQACATLCTGKIPPSQFVMLTATATDPDADMHATQTAQEYVRVH